MTTDDQKYKNFRYRDVALQGRPTHQPMDNFSIRHPAMPLSRRAKIFSPFDALKGFAEAIASREVSYFPRQQLTEEECRDLNQKISLLRTLVVNSRLTREHPIRICIRHFVPCTDPDSEAYDRLGNYEDLTGICWEVNLQERTITVDEQRIDAEDILSLSILS